MSEADKIVRTASRMWLFFFFTLRPISSQWETTLKKTNGVKRRRREVDLELVHHLPSQCSIMTFDPVFIMASSLRSLCCSPASWRPVGLCTPCSYPSHTGPLEGREQNTISSWIKQVAVIVLQVATLCLTFTLQQCNAIITHYILFLPKCHLLI